MPFPARYADVNKAHRVMAICRIIYRLTGMRGSETIGPVVRHILGPLDS